MPTLHSDLAANFLAATVAAIFAAAPEAGVKHHYVEQDNWDRPSLESARISFEYLNKLG